MFTPEEFQQEDDDMNTNETNDGLILQTHSWDVVKLNPNDSDVSRPSLRSLHVAVAHQHNMYLFGGYDGDRRVNHFHKFDFLNMSWQLVKPSHGEPPSPRDRHSGVVVGDYVLIFGGYDGKARINDLHIFNAMNNTWEMVQRSTQDQYPSARHCHSAVAYDGSMYIFGGYDGAYKNDIYRFDVASCRWTKVAALGNELPPPRYRCSAVVHGDAMYIFGGHDGARHLNDTYQFDFARSRWTKLETSGSTPLPRDSHVSVVFEDCMFIFGGSSGNAMNDFHYLHLPSKKWHAVPSDGWFPCSRFCHTAVEYDNSMYIYGGYDGQVRLRDFHRFKFAPSTCIVERSSLFEDLVAFMNDDLLTDLTIIVSGVPVGVHRVFFMRCPKLLELEIDGIIELADVDFEIFKLVREYLYTDRVKLESFDRTMAVYVLANRFNIPRLMKICSIHISDSINFTNATLIFMTAVRLDVNELREFAKNFLAKHFDEISRLPSFEEMGRENVELIYEITRARAQIQNTQLVDPEISPNIVTAAVATLPVVSGARAWRVVRVDPNPKESQNLNETPCTPTNRSLHSLSAYNDSLYLFGGFNGDRQVNDFFRFDLATRTWWKINNVLGFHHHSHSTFPPTPRDRHSAVVVNDKLWIFGGFDGRTRVNELYAFDFRKKSWNMVAQNTATPSPRHSHATAVHGSTMYVFGGYDSSNRNDLYSFDTNTLEWSAIHCFGTAPSARYRATLVALESQLILFGGHDGLVHLRDVYIFDIGSATWSTVETRGILPGQRDSHCSVVYGDSMYVFGGSNGSATNDFYRLRFKSGEFPAWSRVHAAMAPCARFCHASALHGTSLYVFGGYDGTKRLDDLVQFNFLESKPSVLPPSTLVHEMGRLVNVSIGSDITFVVEGKEIVAHRILCSRCPYFRAMFSTGMRESQEARVTVEDVSYEVFLALIQYLYTDRQEIGLDMAMDLFFCADRFGVERLKNMCENKMLSSIDVNNVSEYFAASQCHNAVGLYDKCLSFIVQNFDVVSKTKTFEMMVRFNNDLLFVILHKR